MWWIIEMRGVSLLGNLKNVGEVRNMLWMCETPGWHVILRNES